MSVAAPLNIIVSTIMTLPYLIVRGRGGGGGVGRIYMGGEVFPQILKIGGGQSKITLRNFRNIALKWGSR